jgi:predicted  nucleic acid-binding Zn-ribbon protein
MERDEKRLADGSTSAKELEKLQHEVQTLSARRSELEEVELEIMLRIDSIKERLQELRAEEVVLVSASEEIQSRKVASSAAIESEITSVIEERKAIAATTGTLREDPK